MSTQDMTRRATSACRKWEFRRHGRGVWGIYHLPADGPYSGPVMHGPSPAGCQRAVDGGHADAALLRRLAHPGYADDWDLAVAGLAGGSR